MDVVSFVSSFVDFSLANPLVQTFAVSAVRTLAGWAQHSQEDGHISKNELKELWMTFWRMFPQTLSLSAVLGPVGALASLGTDTVLTKLGKVADKKK